LPEMPAAPMVMPAAEAGSLALLWRDILIKTLEMGLMSQLKYLPEIASQAQALLAQARAVRTEQEVVKLGEALKSFWFKLEMSSDGQYRLHEELLHLLRLLVDTWASWWWTINGCSARRHHPRHHLQAHGHRCAVQRGKQPERAHLQAGKTQARSDGGKDTLKLMADTFISRLVEMTESTGEYHHKIEKYQEQIRSTEDITSST